MLRKFETYFCAAFIALIVGLGANILLADTAPGYTFPPAVSGSGSVTGGGAVATGGYTLTVPATGTAALLGTANVFTAAQSMTAGKILDSGSDHYITIDTASNEAADRTLTIPALGGNDTLATLALGQTFSGLNTFSNSINIGVDTRRFFVQDATPTANAADDLWYETDTNLLWFWNGTYWLSVQHFTMSQTVSGISATNTTFKTVDVLNADTDIFVTDILLAGIVATTSSGSHYWQIEILNSSYASIGITNTSSGFTADAFGKSKVAVNTLIDTSAISALIFQFSKPVGTPGVLDGTATITYRLAHL